jgi:uncharacterized protein YciI
MFIVKVSYQKPIEEVDRFLVEHRAFLDKGYQQNYLMASGPQNPRVGGIILSQLSDRHQLQEFLAQDPFLIHEIASYEIIEFTPVKFHKDFAVFV